MNTLMGIYNVTGHYDFESQTSTMKVEDLIKFLDYAKSSPGNPLDTYLIANIEYDHTKMDELIGTKYMRVAEWEKAIEYASSEIHWKSNYKIDFAKEMLTMEKEAAIMKGDAQCQRYYDLAIRYAQAGYTGDCWYLTQYSKSVVDTVGVNEKDFAAIAYQLLQKASMAKDKKLKEKALFGSCYYYFHSNHMLTNEWNNATSSFETIEHPESSEFQTWLALEKFELSTGQPTADFISNCDCYKVFRDRNRHCKC